MKRLFILGVSLGLAISPLMGIYANGPESMETRQTATVQTESGRTIDDLIEMAKKFAAQEMNTEVGRYTPFTERKQTDMQENAKDYIRRLEKLKNKGYDSDDLEWWEGIIDSLGSDRWHM